MNDDSSLFEIMQDPLLTMVAIILFGTLWIIIPGGRVSVDGKNSDDITHQLMELDQILQELEQQIYGIQKIIHTEEKSQGEWASSALSRERQAQNDFEQTTREIPQMEFALKKKNEEYAKLQVRLNNARNQHPEIDLIENMQRRIANLEKEIYKKGKIVAELDAKIIKEKKQKDVDGEQPQAIKLDKIEVLREIDLEEVRIKDLQEKKVTLVETLKEKRGTGEYSSTGTTGKAPLVFEADGGKLYLLDDENYEVIKSGYLETKNGKVSAQEIGRKNTAIGDINIVLNEDTSLFKKKLSQASPDKKYIIFVVRKDSFALFLNARTIAEQAGFRVGWVPFADGPIMTGERTAGNAELIVR